jgi:hypothetical protein
MITLADAAFTGAAVPLLAACGCLARELASQKKQLEEVEERSR